MNRKYRHRAYERKRRSMRFEDQVARWILRALVRAGAARAWVTPEGGLEGEASRLIAGLGISLPKTTRPLAPLAMRSLRERLCELEQHELRPSLASENARALGTLLELNRTETEILAFAIALEGEASLRECFAELRGRTHASVCKQLALVLGLRVSAVDRALSPQGTLRSVPVLDYVRADAAYDGPFELSSAVEPLLMRPLVSEQDVLRHFLTRAPAPGLGIADYPHLAADIELLSRYLRAALARRKRGVNVLLHGPPGTGKTELARCIAEALGAQLYEVNLEDSDQDAHEGMARLNAYALSQRFLRKRRDTLLLLDEVEDVFPKHGALQFGWRAGSTLTKAWTNRLLEQNPIPAFWISNAIDQIDRAYVRRFDLVIEIGQPSRSVRRGMLDRHLAALKLPAQYLDRLAGLEELSPAHVQRAASIVSLLRPVDATRAQADLERVVVSNLRAYSGRTPRGLHAGSEPPYDLSLLNLDTDAAAIAAGLCRGKRGSLCFYGPPGTGKTAFARHLAREAGLPIHEQRASDLLDKYIGESEKRIARMFELAERDRALLLLDEADGFLADRRDARNSWELTQVNELLVQMEHFEGLFICSTNLFERLDRAALRRFTLKVAFDYLTRDRARALFAGTLAAFGLAPATEAQLAELDRLRVLTPGDFAAVARGAQLIERLQHAGDLVQALARACAEKRIRGGRALGFGA